MKDTNALRGKYRVLLVRICLESLLKSLRPSIRPYVYVYPCKNCGNFEAIFMKFDIWEFYENRPSNFILIQMW